MASFDNSGFRRRLVSALSFSLALALILSLALNPQTVHSRGLSGDLPDFATLVKLNKAAVVNISIDEAFSEISRDSTTPPKIPGNNDDESEENAADEELNELLREFQGSQEDIPAFRTESLGSGFVLTDDGYILTCAHVIEDASRVVVRFSDRKEYEATVVGTDRQSDVAVLKVEATGLPTVEIGDPAALEVGEWVLAIGSPFGFDSSATSGIVSAKGRSLPNESYVPFIQTDVAINPGNSGGPLFDLEGRVVGINAQIYSRTGGFMGLSFAVPIDLAIRVADQLRENGRVRRGWLGVSIQNVTAQLADSLSMDVPMGALVEEILEQSPASRSELVKGDVIVAFNGVAIGEMSDLPPVVGSTPAGSTVPMRIVRDGQSIELDVTLGELSTDTTVASVPRETSPDSEAQPESDSKSSESSPADDSRVLGMVVESPEQSERKALDLPLGGLVVRSIDSGAAMRSGVKAGDLLIRLGGTDILDASQFQQLIEEKATIPPADGRSDPPATTPLLIRRGNRSLFLALRIELETAAE